MTEVENGWQIDVQTSSADGTRTASAKLRRGAFRAPEASRPRHLGPTTVYIVETKQRIAHTKMYEWNKLAGTSYKNYEYRLRSSHDVTTLCTSFSSFAGGLKCLRGINFRGAGCNFAC